MEYAGGFVLTSSGVKNSASTEENTEFANVWDSGYQYAIQYFDAQGRTIGAQSRPTSAFNTSNAPNNPTVNYPQTFLQIKNRPPLEASYYQVLMSNTT